ncbi:hypothetical protein GGX14DRAFT_696596 [Mycena pura]|uniref:AMP-dependent synthetase/ligase domain-containing protein n=1 Tax=Mycena pura TaxID=153505 RepID=A0AAD6VMB2_9AGAR|nr:hypothetical protein GGX14DRAFT_696596 [Mycena pura]
MRYPTLQAQNSATFTRPPLDGSLFLPDVFEYHAKHSPEHPLFVYADGDAVKHTITWARAAKAFIAGAHIVRRAIGLSDPHERPVVAVLGVSDQSSYLSVLASVMRAGAVPFPISTRNSSAAIAHLLKSTGCAHIIVSTDAAMKTLASGAAAQMADALSMHPMPTFQQLYQEGGSASLKPLPPIGDIDKEAHAIIMHSSGSTAFPKAIPLTQHMMVESGLIPYYSETDFCEQVMSVHAVPMFHMMGFVNFPYCAYSGLTLAVFPPTAPSGVPNPDKVLDAALACESTLILSSPTFLEAWAREPKQVEALNKIRTAIFGGGPLHPAAGEILVKNGVHIAHLYGLTEASCASVFIPESNPPEGWDYFFFSPHTDVEFVPSEDFPDVYRVLLKKCATHTPAVLNAVVNGVPAFDTKDLLLRNPKNPRLWKMFGRHDDQIVHSNGEKTNPAPIGE